MRRTRFAMLIVCPSCASEYTIDADRIGAAPRRVRCAACRETWLVTPPASAPEAPAAGEAEMGPERQAQRPSPAVIEAQLTGSGAETVASAGPARPAAPDARAARPRRALFRRAAVAAALPLALGAGYGVVVARSRVVELAPATARLYAAAGLPVNLAGLDLRAVRSERLKAGAETTLVVEGEIVNASRDERSPPPVAIQVRGGDGRTLYAWTVEPPRQRLAPGETARFRASLAAPPAEGREVLVLFSEGSDKPGAFASAR